MSNPHRHHQDDDHRGRYRYAKRGRRHHSRDQSHEQSREYGGCGIGNAIHRVLRKSREITGMSKGMTIAAYVLGFIFVPLLTAFVALVLLYWTSYPDSAQRNVDRMKRQARRAAHKMGEGFTRGTGPRPVTEPDLQDLDLDDDDDEPTRGRRSDRNRPHADSGPQSAQGLRKRFENLERRARTIERFVASEEYRLQREFDKMDEQEPPRPKPEPKQ